MIIEYKPTIQLNSLERTEVLNFIRAHPDAPLTLEAARTCLKHPGTHVGFAREGDDLFGIVLSRVKGTKSGEIFSILTNQEHRGKGVSVNLFTEAVKGLKENGITRFRAPVTNPAIMEKFRKLGVPNKMDEGVAVFHFDMNQPSIQVALEKIKKREFV